MTILRNVLGGVFLLFFARHTLGAPVDLVCDWTDSESAFAEEEMFNAQTSDELFNFLKSKSGTIWQYHIREDAAKNPGYSIWRSKLMLKWDLLMLKEHEARGIGRLCFSKDGDCPPEVIAKRKKEEEQHHAKRKQYLVKEISEYRSKISRLKNARNSCVAAPFIIRYTFTFDKNDLRNDAKADAEWFAESCAADPTKVAQIVMSATPSLIRFNGLSNDDPDDDIDFEFNVNRRTLEAGFRSERHMQCRIEEFNTQI